MSRAEYHLNVTLATSKRARPWNASEPSEGWTNHVMDLTGNLVLKHHDVEQGDFEVRRLQQGRTRRFEGATLHSRARGRMCPSHSTPSSAQLRALGFDWHCPILVEPPVLGYRAPDQGPFKYPGAGQASDSSGEAAAQSSAAAPEGAGGSVAPEQQAGRGRAGAKQPAWDFHLASSLGPDTKVRPRLRGTAGAPAGCL